MELSEYCGHARGVADAAVRDCTRTIRLLKNASDPVEWPAREIYERFVEAVWPREEAPATADFEFESYRGAVHGFQQRLHNLCADMDAVVAAEAGLGVGISRDLNDLQKRDLRELKDELRALDKSFENFVHGWLNKRSLSVPMSVWRGLGRRAQQQYEHYKKSGREVPFVHPRQGAAARPEGDDGHGAGNTPHEDEASTCERCIWLCPHAPGRDADRQPFTTSAGTGGSVDPESTGPSSSELPHAQEQAAIAIALPHTLCLRSIVRQRSGISHAM